MKKIFKKSTALISAIVILLSLIPVSAGAARVGDVIGYAQPTDIVATINGYQLESYNVNGLTYICVEDLRHYGFDVYFDMYSKSLSFSRNYNISVIDPQNTNPAFWSIGSGNGWKNILYTDIATYANGEYVTSSNIDGQTIINFNELGRFGTLAYDNNRREISLVMDDVKLNVVDLYAKEIQKESDKTYNPDWKIMYRAKGDVFMVIGNARTYMNQNQQNMFINVIIPDDKRDAEDLLEKIRSYDIPVSSVYVEYKNTDGSVITSYQVY